jgi:hypothetical protein
MGKPFSGDLRERIVGAVQAGRSCHEVARIFGVSASCVINLIPHEFEFVHVDKPHVGDLQVRDHRQRQEGDLEEGLG